MTTIEATKFEQRSTTSYKIARACRQECDCEPYRDMYTYRRWQAQGFQVRRGEKAIRLPLVKYIARKEEESEEAVEVKILGQSYVFCRCQVGNNGNGSNGEAP